MSIESVPRVDAQVEEVDTPLYWQAVADTEAYEAADQLGLIAKYATADEASI